MEESRPPPWGDAAPCRRRSPHFVLFSASHRGPDPLNPPPPVRGDHRIRVMVGSVRLALLAALLLPLAAAELISNSTLSETQCTGDEAEGTYCFVASSTFPRVCDCVRNVCPSASISETTNCFICDRGAPPPPLPPHRRRRCRQHVAGSASQPSSSTPAPSSRPASQVMASTPLRRSAWPARPL